ncbi:MAG: putative toxin-antitoxin system toxin component, PIN family [Chitinophagaceae bacterium]|nr:putative toxin-antitoxin system toxin component, PIN family [Chitinophagaceae bacterium]
MTVVIDCNVLVMCLTSRSPWHIIYQSLIAGKYNLAITDEIVLEYEETIQKKYGITTANAFISLLSELPNVFYLNTYYRWQLIEADADDNKYCDGAVAGKADYLVSEDNHFNILKTIPFPKITVVSIDEFAAMLNQ